MTGIIDIKKIIDIVIETEEQAAANYKELAYEAEALKPAIFYAPHKDKISWNEEVGFYKELEEQVLGTDEGSKFYLALPPKVLQSDSAVFYRGLGDRFTENVKEVLLGIAKEELEHAETIRTLFVDIDNNDADLTFSSEIATYLDKNMGEVRPYAKITVPSSMLMALEQAVLNEQNAIKFYSGMMSYAKPKAVDILKKIINEEKGHENRLKSQIKSYKLFLETV